MKRENSIENKNIYEIIFAGGLLLLSLKNILFILLFISEILCVFLIKDINLTIYVFFGLIVFWFYAEWKVLKRYLKFISNLKFAISLYISLIFIGYAITYIDATFVNNIVVDNFGREGILNLAEIFNYPNFVFVVHNLLLIVFLLFRKKL